MIVFIFFSTFVQNFNHIDQPFMSYIIGCTPVPFISITNIDFLLKRKLLDVFEMQKADSDR